MHTGTWDHGAMHGTGLLSDKFVTPPPPPLSFAPHSGSLVVEEKEKAKKRESFLSMFGAFFPQIMFCMCVRVRVYVCVCLCVCVCVFVCVCVCL